MAIVFLSLAPQFSFAGDCNDLVLEQVSQMPKGGRYSVSHFAKIRLQSSAHFESGKFFIIPAGPSFCSGATYLVFIRTIEALRERGQLNLDFGTLEHLIIRDQHDGEDVWDDGTQMARARRVCFTNCDWVEISTTSTRRSRVTS